MAKNPVFKRGCHYFQCHDEIMDSPAYRDLSTGARCLLLEFQRIYRPGRNGNLSISTRNAAELLNKTQPTVLRYFNELESHGFSKLTEPPDWPERRARKWTLTSEPCNRRQPTDDWKRWTPDNPLPVTSATKKNLRVKKLSQHCPKNLVRL